MATNVKIIHEQRAEVILDWPRIRAAIIFEAAREANFTRLANAMRETDGPVPPEYKVDVFLIKTEDGEMNAEVRITEDLNYVADKE